MILAIDTGNTHTVLGLLGNNNEILGTYRIPTDRHDTEFGYAAKIKLILELAEADKKGLEGAIISSVVPQVTKALKTAIKLLTGIDALVIGEGVNTDLVIKLEGGIAPDLEIAAVAVKELYPLPSIVIDMGTANTITVVNKAGEYLGGVIYPGVGISLNALVDSTSLLPGISIEAPNKTIATDTIDAMKAGIVYGQAGSVDGIVNHFVKEMGEEPASIVATGGLGPLICQYCDHDIVCDDNLLLKGLGIIYKKNK